MQGGIIFQTSSLHVNQSCLIYDIIHCTLTNRVYLIYDIIHYTLTNHVLDKNWSYFQKSIPTTLSQPKKSVSHVYTISKKKKIKVTIRVFLNRI